MTSLASAACPRCSTTSHWRAEIVLPPIVPGGQKESVFYFQCRKCNHIWVPSAPQALWPPFDTLKEA